MNQKAFNRTLILFLLISSFALIGCSGNYSPVNPSGKPVINVDAKLQVGVSERFPDGSPAAGYGFFGLFSVDIDPKSLTGTVSPLRTSALEDVLEVVDITNFLSLAPCSNCVKMKSVSLDTDGHVVVAMGIKHPFPAGDPFKPISGRNRADLHVFNVEGVVVTDGAGSIDFPGLEISGADTGVINADGFTSYLDSSLDNIFETISGIHPYKLFFDDFTNGNYDPSNATGFASVTDPPPTGHLVMPMGSDYDFKDYIFDLKDGTDYNFIFAVGCTYAISALTMSDRFSPEYRLPQHNKKAATMVNVKIVVNDLLAGDTSSKAELEIDVVDVNHGIAVGTALNEMRADSSVGSIEMEIPGIATSVVSVLLTPSSGDGLTPATALIYPVTITNETGAGIGKYLGLVKVTDTCPTGLNGSPTLNAKDGIARVDPLINPINALLDIPEFATYSIFVIPIERSNLPPVASLKPVGALISMGQTITWDATESTDPDGSIVLYEWDYDIPDGDPANFTPDTQGPDGAQESNPYDTGGTFFAAVRVTDDLGATDIAVQQFDVSLFVPTYWTQYAHDARHDCKTNLTGPQTNHVEWTYTAAGSNALHEIEGHDGTIYYGMVSNAGRLFAVNPDGSEKWIYNPSLPSGWNKPLGVSDDDTILYIGPETGFFEGRIAGVDTATGNEVWITSYMYYVSANTYGLVLDNGDLVVSGIDDAGDSTIRLDKDGNQLWRTPNDWNWCTAPAQGLDGTIYCKSSSDILGLNPDSGAVEHTVDISEASLNTQACFAVRSDGSVIFAGNIMMATKVWCFEPDLSIRWTALPGEGIPIDGFGIGLNDEIYFTVSGGTLYALSPDGQTVLWTYPNTNLWTTPVVDANGLIYVGMDSPPGVVALNTDGSVKWSYTGSAYGCPIIAHDGSLYANMGGNLLKFKDE